MNDNNYPWPMDADIDTLKREMLAFPRSNDPTHYDDLCYILDRLKIAEAERDRCLEESSELKRVLSGAHLFMK